MSIALICIAILGILTIGMGFFVSITRARTGIIIGQPDDPDHALSRAIRAHGNTAEYSAMIAVLIYVLGTLDPAFWVQVFMVGIVVARLLLITGILTAALDRPTAFRFIGSLGTYVLGTGLALALLLSAV